MTMRRAPPRNQMARRGISRTKTRTLPPGLKTSARRLADLLAVGAFLTFAFISFFRKSVPLKYATLVGAVVYLGFYKSQLISIVNVFGLFGGNLPIFRQNLAWYLLTIVTVVSTVLWGRVYCGRLCAFGALTQLLDRVAPNRWQIKIPKRDRTACLAHQVRDSRRRHQLLRVHARPVVLSVHRAVLDVRALR